MKKLLRYKIYRFAGTLLGLIAGSALFSVQALTTPTPQDIDLEGIFANVDQATLKAKTKTVVVSNLLPIFQSMQTIPAVVKPNLQGVLSGAGIPLNETVWYNATQPYFRFPLVPSPNTTFTASEWVSWGTQAFSLLSWYNPEGAAGGRFLSSTITDISSFNTMAADITRWVSVPDDKLKIAAEEKSFLLHGSKLSFRIGNPEGNNEYTLSFAITGH